MKRVRIIAALLIAFGFVACNDESFNEETIDAQVAEADIASEQSADATFEEIDDIVEEGILIAPGNGRAEMGRGESLQCAEVSHDEENKIIEIVFDGTCEGAGGHVKSGKVIITYNDRRYVPGAFRSVTFENFFFDSVQVEGTRTITNVSESFESAVMFNTKMEGGKLTFPDGSFITREADHTRTWERANTPVRDVVRLTGSASGTRRDGVSYTSEITTELVFQASCIASGTARVPVSGVKEINWGENTLTVDFGDGSCDNLASVTLNGTTVEKEINPRGHRRRR
ncbi:MAG: hypothetical protein AAFQ94_07215 [Bacteroidota bacterium]